MTLDLNTKPCKTHLQSTTDLAEIQFNISMINVPSELKKLLCSGQKIAPESLAKIIDRNFNIEVDIFNYKIKLAAILNTKPTPSVSIQLLEDEIIDHEEINYSLPMDLDAQEEETDVEDDECEFSMSISDAFREQLFLEDGWRFLHTILSLRYAEKGSAIICEDIYSLVCENINKWLNTLYK